MNLNLTNLKVAKTIDVIQDLPRHDTKRYDQRDPFSCNLIVVHTTDWDTTPKRIAEYDVAKNHISNTGCPGITYHEIIMPGGLVYQTLPYQEASWHAGPHNARSIAIALMYRVSNEHGEDTFAPTSIALDSLYSRCGELCLKYFISPDQVQGHRELSNTGWVLFKGSKKLRKTCPGMKVDLDLVRANVAAYIQISLKAKGFYTDEIDGNWGKQSCAALAAYKTSLVK